MKTIRLMLLLGTIALALPAFAARQDADLGPLATETALLLGGAYSSHLDDLERIFRSDGVALPAGEKERCLSVVAGMKKDVRQHIDTANTIKKSLNLYGKSELVAQAFGLHVILSQCAYSALTMEQVLIECVGDSKWRLQFKKDKGRVHLKLLEHQEKCFSYALGIL